MTVGGFAVLELFSDRLGFNMDRWQIGGPATWAWMGGTALYYRFRYRRPPNVPEPGVRRRVLGWLGFLAAAGLSSLIVGQELHGPLKGLYWRVFRTPAVLRASFLEEFDPKSAHAELQRRRLMDIWSLGRESFGLRMTFSSIEGQVIVQCVATEKGRLSYVYDATRDSYGPRRFLVGHPDRLLLDRPADSEVTVMDELWPDSRRTYLKVRFPSGRTFFF